METGQINKGNKFESVIDFPSASHIGHSNNKMRLRRAVAPINSTIKFSVYGKAK